MMLDLLWWVGLAWFAFWTALPLALSPLLGPALGLLVWPLLAPWTALLGIGLAHRLLPESKPGMAVVEFSSAAVYVVDSFR